MRSVAAVGSWSASRPWRAIALWLGFVVLALALGAATGTESLESGATGESQRGYDLIELAQGGFSPVQHVRAAAFVGMGLAILRLPDGHRAAGPA